MMQPDVELLDDALTNHSSELNGVMLAENELANQISLSLPYGSRSVLIMFYTLAALLSVIGNMVVIVVLLTGTLSRTDLRVYLINLAVADLVMAVFCMPFTFTMTMLGTWVFSEAMCPIVLYMQIVSVTASVGTNMAIGVDRYMVVIHSLRSRITKARPSIVLGTIWLVAAALSSVQLLVGRSMVREAPLGGGFVNVTDCYEAWPEPSGVLRRTYTFFILILTYLLPLAILVSTYSVIAWKLWKRTVPGNADKSRDAQQLQSKRKVIKMLLAVVILFALCWLPLHVFILVVDFNAELTKSEREKEVLIAIYYVVHWLAMSNSFVNPIIYSFLNDNFKNDLRRLCREASCVWRQRLTCACACWSTPGDTPASASKRGAAAEENL